MDFQILAEFKNQADKYTVQTELNNSIIHRPTLVNLAVTPTSRNCRARQNLIQAQIIKHNLGKNIEEINCPIMVKIFKKHLREFLSTVERIWADLNSG